MKPGPNLHLLLLTLDFFFSEFQIKSGGWNFPHGLTPPPPAADVTLEPSGTKTNVLVPVELVPVPDERGLIQTLKPEETSWTF